jgi:FkbM family methyltransferase
MYLENKLKVTRSPSGDISLSVNGRPFTFFSPEPLKNLVLEVLYGLEYPLPALANYQPEVIIDIGANVGATSLYFHANFPDAEIYCYEPSAKNYRFLQLNTRHFGNIKTFPYGLLNKSTELPMYQGYHQSAENSIIRSIETTDATEIIKLNRFSDELRERNIDKISFLKLDTEGCEILILEDILDKLDLIDMMFIEYHSEKNRLKIDDLLAGYFLLFYSSALRPHRGTVLYISKKLLAKYSYFEEYKLEMD